MPNSRFIHPPPPLNNVQETSGNVLIKIHFEDEQCRLRFAFLISPTVSVSQNDFGHNKPTSLSFA
jgi:hypothetical protein